MYRPLALVLLWVLLFAATIAIVRVDRGRRDPTDFADRGLGPFLFVTALTGPIALVIYFHATRGGRRGLLVGLGALLAVLAGGALAGAGLFLGARALEARDRVQRERAACSAPPLGDGDAACLGAAKRYLDEGSDHSDPALGQELLDAACVAGHLDACIRLAQLWETGALGPADRTRAMAALAKGKEICAKRTSPTEKCRAVEVLAGRPGGAAGAPEPDGDAAGETR